MAFQRVGPKSRQVIALSTASIEAYEGAVRSSKTITSILDFAMKLRSPTAGEFAIVGRTERTAYRNIVEPMIQMFGKTRVQYNRGLGELTVFGRKGYLIGANNEAARTKIQGLTLLYLYMDEAATLPESFFNMAYTRLSVAGAKMWLTANPEGRNHWLLTNWLAKARLWVKADASVVRNPESPIDLHRYTFVIDDNPHLAAAFVQRLKNSYVGVWYRRFILSEWTNAEGAIFDMFDPDLHVRPVDTFPALERFLVGVDYGTTNPTAAVMLGLGPDGRLYVVDEWGHDARQGEARWTNAQLSTGLRGWMTAKALPVQWIAVDPSAASFHTQLFHDGARNVLGADNRVLDGIRTTASLLATGDLIIADHCTRLLAEMPGYAWDPKATEKGEDRPIKLDDHWVDGLRYGCMAAVANWSGRLNYQPTEGA